MAYIFEIQSFIATSVWVGWLINTTNRQIEMKKPKKSGIWCVGVITIFISRIQKRATTKNLSRPQIRKWVIHHGLTKKWNPKGATCPSTGNRFRASSLTPLLRRTEAIGDVQIRILWRQTKPKLNLDLAVEEGAFKVVAVVLVVVILDSNPQTHRTSAI
jgi:hypothetical protein